jgi:hypothetical protein
VARANGIATLRERLDPHDPVLGADPEAASFGEMKVVVVERVLGTVRTARKAAAAQPTPGPRRPSPPKNGSATVSPSAPKKIASGSAPNVSPAPIASAVALRWSSISVSDGLTVRPSIRFAVS